MLVVDSFLLTFSSQGPQTVTPDGSSSDEIIGRLTIPMVDWNEILIGHGPVVWRTVYRLLGQHADAMDCYQETFLAAYRWSERHPVGHWPAFLTSLATRRAIDRLRQARAIAAGGSRRSKRCRSRSAGAIARSSTLKGLSVWTKSGNCSPGFPRSRPRSSG